MTDNISQTDANIINCPQCEEQISAKAIVCKHCGYVLIDVGNDALKTVLIPRPDTDDEVVETYPHGTSRFSPSSVLYISIERVNTPIARFVNDNPIILGREQTTLLARDDINLDPYNARERGVSRRHAQIYAFNGKLFIEDLNSSNGTSLNGEELEPNKPHRLRDGDEIMLGRMMVWVNF